MDAAPISVNGSWWVPRNGPDSILALVRFGGVGRLDLCETSVTLDVNGRWNFWRSVNGPRGKLTVPLVIPLTEIERVETRGRWLTTLRFRLRDHVADGVAFTARRSKIAPVITRLRSVGVEVVG
jgi:hypothetical protein